MTGEYHSRAWFWEFVKMYLKLLIMCCLTFLEQDIPNKILFIFLLVACYGFMLNYFKPYKQELFNRIDLIQTGIQGFSFYLGFLAYQNSDSDIIILSCLIFIAVINIIFIIWSFKMLTNVFFLSLKPMFEEVKLFLVRNRCIGKILFSKQARLYYLRRRWIKSVIKTFKSKNIINAWTGKFKINKKQLAEILRCESIQIDNNISKQLAKQMIDSGSLSPFEEKTHRSKQQNSIFLPESLQMVGKNPFRVQLSKKQQQQLFDEQAGIYQATSNLIGNVSLPTSPVLSDRNLVSLNIQSSKALISSQTDETSKRIENDDNEENDSCYGHLKFVPQMKGSEEIYLSPAFHNNLPNNNKYTGGLSKKQSYICNAEEIIDFDDDRISQSDRITIELQQSQRAKSLSFNDVSKQSAFNQNLEGEASEWISPFEEKNQEKRTFRSKSIFLPQSLQIEGRNPFKSSPLTNEPSQEQNNSEASLSQLTPLSLGTNTHAKINRIQLARNTHQGISCSLEDSATDQVYKQVKDMIYYCNVQQAIIPESQAEESYGINFSEANQNILLKNKFASAESCRGGKIKEMINEDHDQISKSDRITIELLSLTNNSVQIDNFSKYLESNKLCLKDDSSPQSLDEKTQGSLQEANANMSNTLPESLQIGGKSPFYKKSIFQEEYQQLENIEKTNQLSLVIPSAKDNSFNTSNDPEQSQYENSQGPQQINQTNENASQRVNNDDEYDNDIIHQETKVAPNVKMDISGEMDLSEGSRNNKPNRSSPKQHPSCKKNNDDNIN